MWKKFKKFLLKETVLSLIITLIFYFIIDKSKLFDNYNDLEGMLKYLSITIGSALIGFLGIVLTGAGIFISLFDKDFRKKINEVKLENTKDNIEALSKEFKRFYFLSLNTGFFIILSIMFHFILHSKQNILPIYLYKLLLLGMIYYLSYILFYTIDLLRLLIESFKTIYIYEVVSILEKQEINILTEVKLEYLLSKYIANNGVNIDEFLEGLGNIVNAKNISLEKKEKIKQYLDKYYRP